MKRFGLILLLCLAPLFAHAAARNRTRHLASEAGAYDGGYVITAQFKCLDLLCPHWELDVSALNHVDVVPILLYTLVPKSPAENMNFPVFTAYDAATRRFTVLGLAASDDVRLWTLTIAADAKSAQLISTVSLTLPANAGLPVSLHYAARTGGAAQLLAVMEEGFVAAIDPQTGTISPPIALLPGGNTRAVGSNAIDAAANLLYVALRAKVSSQYQLVTFDLVGMRPTANSSVHVPGDTLELENAFFAFVDNSTHTLYWLVTGRFDQILQIDPSTGNGRAVIGDMSQQNYFFYVDQGTHSDDTLHVDAYDPVTNRLYMQANTLEDDQFTPEFIYWNVGGEFFYVVWGPITFGLSGFQWVTV